MKLVNGIKNFGSLRDLIEKGQLLYRALSSQFAIRGPCSDNLSTASRLPSVKALDVALVY